MLLSGLYQVTLSHPKSWDGPKFHETLGEKVGMGPIQGPALHPPYPPTISQGREERPELTWKCSSHFKHAFLVVGPNYLESNNRP